MKMHTKLGAVAMILALPLAACDVDQTQEGELPEVEGGQLPEYDVETGDIDVTEDTATIIVPDVDIDVPDEDVPPEEGGR